ncbi:hypothetical protein MTO96_036465 [Rhipicephalus appendiculatus]
MPFLCCIHRGEDRCGPDAAKKCYLKYDDATLWNEFRIRTDGVYDEEELKIGCSRFKGKIQCHKDLADCPEMANGDYRIQERGYETLSNIFCDIKTIKDTHAAILCIDFNKANKCAKSLAGDAASPPAGDDPHSSCSRGHLHDGLRRASIELVLPSAGEDCRDSAVKIFGCQCTTRRLPLE